MTVNEIIRCPKVILRKKRVVLAEEHRHMRADIQLSCEGLSSRMTMFLRRLVDLPEDYSVGLRLDEPCDPLQFAAVLVRYQGPHGGQSVSRTARDLHNSAHVHLYSEEDALCRRKKASYKEPAEFTFSRRRLWIF